MTESSGSNRGKIPLKPFIKDFRSSMTDQELKDKYKLSPRAYLSLIKALLEKNFISDDDVVRRREMAVQRDLAKEAQFLAGLYICPSCGHPHPQRFDVCPACEVDVSEVLENQEALTAVSTTGGHFYVEDIVGEEDAEIDDMLEDEPVEDNETEKDKKSDEPKKDPPAKEKPSAKEKPAPKGKSAVGAITSFFSRKKKKDK